MILRVWSDLPSFREASFQDGLNVVLADRADDSEDTESTNGLGKTTLLRIIHFCLGSDLAKDKVLSHPKLKGVSFGLDLEFDSKKITVTRNTSTPKSVTVTAAFLDKIPVQVESIEEDRITISLSDWKRTLSFRFVSDAKAGSAESSFREIALYLIRLGKPAFADPQTAFQGQSGPSKRLTTSYLLGLNWSGQHKLQNLIDTRNQVNAAIKALKDAAASANDKSIGELEAERVALEASIVAKRVEVESFNVREDYSELQGSLTDVDRRLHELINENHLEKRLLQHYRKSAAELPEADASRPISILQNAGAIFREDVLKTLDEVAAFHVEVHRNRSAFLNSEVARLKKDIAIRNSAISELASQKSQILGILQTSGALENLIELQRTYTELNSHHEALKARIAERVKFDLRKEELSAEIAQERTLMKRDMDDRKKVIDEARLLFAEYTKFLYGKPGGLGVDIGPSGYSLKFSIDREGSDGVDQMVVFCFDLMVATLRARHKAGFCTLIHDSALFADVDPRQYGLALRLAEERARIEGFQYICCLNAGALPVQHLGDLELEKFIRLRLTDEGESGRLLGMRLPPREHAA